MISKSQLKYIQSLGQKKCRDEEDVFIAEGPKLVAELLNEKNVIIKQVFALKQWVDEYKNILSDIQCHIISEEELARISQLKTPNQVFAVAEKIKWGEPISAGNKITLMLDTIQDPGNMGTIIRIADWFGVNQVLCSDNSADIYNPKVVQATMGSIARVQVEYTGLVPWLEKNEKIRIYAAVMEGQDVSKIGRLKEGIIIIGNESKGINEELMASVNVRITIPRIGRAESLNAAVATGILLSHLC